MKANRPQTPIGNRGRGIFVTGGRGMPTPPKVRPLSGSNTKPTGGPAVRPVKPRNA